MSNDDEFEAMIESAYAEPMMISGEVGDDDVTQVAPTPPRPGLDRGIAGSLIQERERLRKQRREETRSGWRDRVSIVAGVVFLGCAIGLGVLIGGSILGISTVPVPGLAGAVLLLIGAAAVWVLWMRHGPSSGERNLAVAINAEQRVGRELADALAGSSWMLFFDRRLPHSEHRVPFLAVGPGGLAVIAIIPAGPYLILTPTGVKAGDDELAYGWLPARIWEARYLMRQLANTPARDLQFSGPVIPVAVEGYLRATKVPVGWSAQPPYRIDAYPIRTPAALGKYLQYLPVIFAPHHVLQLAQLVDEYCQPAPWPEG